MQGTVTTFHTHKASNTTHNLYTCLSLDVDYTVITFFL